MKEIITIQELVKQTKELQKLFRQAEHKPWTIDTFVMELLAETGTLADSIMIKEQYRKPRPIQPQINLEDDVCDVLFVLFMIADYYGINIEKSYKKMIDSTRKKLESSMNLS